MKYFALAAALLTSAAFAIPGPQQGDQGSFNIGAFVEDACVMTQPTDVFIGSLSWMQPDAMVTGTTSVNVKCNAGAFFMVGFDGTQGGGDAQVTLTGGNGFGPGTLAATVTGQSQGLEIAGDGNDAATTAGYTKTFTVSIAKPTQANAGGFYSGTVNVLLTALGQP